MSEMLNISWNDIAREDWDRALEHVCAAYQQDWAYGDLMQGVGANVMRASIRDNQGELVALAQIIVKPFALVGRFALSTFGPIWLKPLSNRDKETAYKLLKTTPPISPPRLQVFTPEDTQEVYQDKTGGLRRLKRVMTGAATVRIDLTQDAESMRKNLDQKWRNRLNAAEKSDLKYVKGGVKPSQFNWLLNLEEKQREKRGYRALPAELTLAWQEAKSKAKGAPKNTGVALYRADLGKDTAGAMLVLIHGCAATYHIGWTSDDGRKLGAHNLCLWNACLDLKERGVKSFDLGGVNTQSGAGIARFKIGTGGAVIERAGAFV